MKEKLVNAALEANRKLKIKQAADAAAAAGEEEEGGGEEKTKRSTRKEQENMLNDVTRQKDHLENQLSMLASQLQENKRLNDVLLLALQCNTHPPPSTGITSPLPRSNHRIKRRERVSIFKWLARERAEHQRVNGDQQTAGFFNGQARRTLPSLRSQSAQTEGV